MKNLEEFYTDYIFEANAKKWPEDKAKIENDPEIKNAVPAKDVKVADVKKNDTADSKKGVWAVDPPNPKWEEELAKLDIDALDNNSYELSERFDDKHDFLVLGEAGWAKTAIIESMAKKHGYNILTVYLDKAVATDLGGIPVPSQTKKGELFMDYSVPGWALYMLQHPKDKFLLFFDEMNQAAPDVLNALMPIVLKHVVCGIEFGDQFIVGAAGNLAHENESLSELNKPLRDRFKPIIEWEVHTEDSWKSSFEFLHKKFDAVIGEEFINKLQENCNIWNSPRDLTRVILDFVKANKERTSGRQYSRPNSIKNKILACVWDDADTSSRKFESTINELTDYMVQYVKGEISVSSKKSSRNSAKGMDQVNPNDKKAIINALEKGYFYYNDSEDGGTGEKYLATIENIIGDEDDPNDHGIFGIKTTGVNREVLKKIIREMEASGKPPKYKTNKEGAKDAKKNGWQIAWTSAGSLVKHNLKHVDDEDDEPKPKRKYTSND